METHPSTNHWNWAGLIIVENKNGLESLRDHDVAQELTQNSWIVLISVGCRVAVCWPTEIHNNVRLDVLKQSGLVYRDAAKGLSLVLSQNIDAFLLWDFLFYPFDASVPTLNLPSTNAASFP
jgi:hypothetical protein